MIGESTAENLAVPPRIDPRKQREAEIKLRRQKARKLKVSDPEKGAEMKEFIKDMKEQEIAEEKENKKEFKQLIDEEKKEEKKEVEADESGTEPDNPYYRPRRRNYQFGDGGDALLKGDLINETIEGLPDVGASKQPKKLNEEQQQQAAASPLLRKAEKFESVGPRTINTRRVYFDSVNSLLKEKKRLNEEISSLTKKIKRTDLKFIDKVKLFFNIILILFFGAGIVTTEVQLINDGERKMKVRNYKKIRNELMGKEKEINKRIIYFQSLLNTQN